MFLLLVWGSAAFTLLGGIVQGVDTAEEKVMTLFPDLDDLDVFLPVKNSEGIQEGFMNLTVNMKVLKENNASLAQVRAAWIEKNNEGGQDVIIGGKRRELQLTTSTMILFHDIHGKSDFLLNLNRFHAQTMKDIENDPALIPLDPVKINWIPPPKCDLKSILINVTGYEIELNFNDILTSTYKAGREKTGHDKREGLFLSVVNPHTCNTTLEYVVSTSDIGGYRDLLWGLESIASGKIVLLASLKDGAAFMDQKARRAIVKMGSLWAKMYLYRDSWFNLFVKGGKVIHDVLIPNLGMVNCSGSPLAFHFDARELVSNDSNECLSWPSDDRWEARKIFCQTHDGFGSLCDCRQPFEFLSNDSASEVQIPDQRNYTQQPLPVIITTGKKTRHLFHLFQSLAPQTNLAREDILLIVDGHHEETTRLAFILGLKILVHKQEGNGSAIIARNLRFALFQGLQVFPKAECFIVLEDDLVLAPDFYSYMNQMAPIFKLDKTIYAVSAFNHLSYPHTSANPTLTYRVQCYPAYGWMMPRYIVEEILPLWLPANITHDWDFFVGSSIVRKERECVVPDINRSYHWSTKGFHNRASHMAETLYLSRGLNTDADVVLQPLDRLIKKNYDKEMISLVKESIPVHFTTRSDLDEVVTPGKTFAIYLSQEEGKKESSFRLFGLEMEIWTMDKRDHYNHVWRFPYRNATILAIGVPISPYSQFVSANQSALVGDDSSDQEIRNGEFFYRAASPFYTHLDFFFLPTWAQPERTNRHSDDKQNVNNYSEVNSVPTTVLS